MHTEHTDAHDHDHAHDLGLSHDLPRLLGRRNMLKLLGGIGVASVSGLPAAALECIALPWETAGPYPADGSNSRNGQVINVLTQEGVIRTDMRPSFGDFSGDADGVQLDMELTLVAADGCTPLTGHAIYVWHCDTDGKYSLYDFPEANFLRAVGISDDSGKVQFTTIVPGCYDGRWPHIHFEVYEDATAAVSGGDPMLTAQIAMPEADSSAVYNADDRYATSVPNLGRISIATDNVFSDNTEAQIEQQTMTMSGSPEAGYTGSVIIPIDPDADRTMSMPAPPPQRG